MKLELKSSTEIETFLEDFQDPLLQEAKLESTNNFHEDITDEEYSSNLLTPTQEDEVISEPAINSLEEIHPSSEIQAIYHQLPPSDDEIIAENNEIVTEASQLFPPTVDSTSQQSATVVQSEPLNSHVETEIQLTNSKNTDTTSPNDSKKPY